MDEETKKIEEKEGMVAEEKKKPESDFKKEKKKRNLSWKFLLPFGTIWLIIFNNSIFALVGTISVIMGIIDLGRMFFKKNK